jgi:lipopolysaccharide heptosyltransferase II
MCTPAFRAIKESLPGADLTLLSSDFGSDIAKLIPEIDQIIPFQAPWIKSTVKFENSYPMRNMITKLKKMKFDASIIMTTYSQSPFPAAMLCFLADIKRRLAYAHENQYQLLSHWIPDPEPNTLRRHETQRQLDLVASVGFITSDNHLSLKYRPEVEEKMRSLIKTKLRISMPWFLLNAGASAPSRRYPLHHFAKIIDLMCLKGWRPVLTGSVEEFDLINDLMCLTDHKPLNLCGKLDLEELSALIALSPLLISNNTGPAHIAAAVDTPAVVIYAQTNLQHYPWSKKCAVLTHDVDCKNCLKSVCPKKHHNCLELIDPVDVINTAESLLKNRIEL